MTPRRTERPVLVAVAVGGVVGAEARYAVSLWLPTRPGGWPMGTWLINVSGCFLIGVLMVVVTELTAAPHRLIRPFLGVGVLGGYTTFSTAMVEALELSSGRHEVLALGYLFGSAVSAVAATALGSLSARRLGRARARRQRGAERTPP